MYDIFNSLQQNVPIDKSGVYIMERNLALELVRVTEAAALATSPFIGRGDEKAADAAAVMAMRQAFQNIAIKGKVVIGEGERDQAPMLYIGESLGRRAEQDPEMDIALDPLEGTTLCAHGSVGALSVIAMGEKGKLLHAPDVYMKKIAGGKEVAGIIDLNLSVSENIHRVAEIKRKSIKDVTTVILDRPRHRELISEIRKIGSRIYLIRDGDISAAIATAIEETGIDLLMGVGGAPEGVLAAAALRCLNGSFQGQLQFSDEKQIQRAKEMNVKDPHHIYKLHELAAGPVMFCATGITDGPLLKGVRTLLDYRAKTHSIVMRSRTETCRTIEAVHNLKKKPGVLK